MAEGQKYFFGHSDPEIERLQLQAKTLEPTTRRLIRESGIAPGMRVLDVGCGAGDVSMLVAEAVGPKGSVVALDREPKVLETAKRRAEAGGYGQIEFVAGDGSEIEKLGSFDAAVGRYVLVHQSDPVSLLIRTAAAVKPGGILAFHEVDLSVEPKITPPVELWEGIARMTLLTRRSFPSYDLGGRFVACFHDAGLPNPKIIWECLGGGYDSPYVDYILYFYKFFAPTLEKAGLTDPRVGDPATLEERFKAAMAEVNAQVVGIAQVCAWAIKP